MGAGEIVQKKLGFVESAQNIIAKGGIG